MTERIPRPGRRQAAGQGRTLRWMSCLMRFQLCRPLGFTQKGARGAVCPFGKRRPPGAPSLRSGQRERGHVSRTGGFAGCPALRRHEGWERWPSSRRLWPGRSVLGPSGGSGSDRTTFRHREMKKVRASCKVRDRSPGQMSKFPGLGLGFPAWCLRSSWAWG